MNTQNEIIGELIQEITGNGFEMRIDVDDTPPTRCVCVEIIADAFEDPLPGMKFDGYDMTQNFEAGNMIEALEMAVNAIRRHLGKPTLAEEVANMIAEQEQHAQTMIHCGPGAKCPCGSPFLIVEKSPKYNMAVDLATGEVCFTEQPAAFTVEDGELARCPSCKNWFHLRA
jgi:hypothetical protein